MRVFAPHSLLPASSTGPAGALAAEALSAPVIAARLARHAEEARGTLAPATEALIRTAARRFGRWCAEAGLPALPRRSTGPLKAIGTRDMLRIIKRRTGDAYSCHSTRVGAAQDARAIGQTTGAIQQAGGWKSEMMVARYTARLATRDSAAAHLAKAQGR